MAGFEIPDGWTVQGVSVCAGSSPAQVSMLESHCGAARFAFIHMLGVVKANWISAPRSVPTASPSGISRQRRAVAAEAAQNLEPDQG